MTRRYALTGPSDKDLALFVGGGAVRSKAFPSSVIDIDVDADDAAIAALDEYMGKQGWEYFPGAEPTVEAAAASAMLDKVR